jgi:integrase
MARPATGTVVERKLAGGAVRFALKFRAHGERVYESLGTDTEGWDRERAQEALKDRLAQVRLGLYVPPPARASENGAGMGFHEFASMWFDQRRHELRDSTVDAISWRLCHVLLPYFAGHRLSEITVEEVDRYRLAKVRERDALIAARKRGDPIERRPLSNSTINRTIGLLAQILEMAVEYGHLPANPARGKRRKLKAARPQRSYLDSAAQIVALLDAAARLDGESRADRQHVNRRAQLATLVFAGLRISEFTALRWRDVDLAGGWITVGHAKTDAGARKVKIRPVLRDVLTELRARARTPSATAYVFGTAEGKRQFPSNIRGRVLGRAVTLANEALAEQRQAPLPALTPHGLRRSFASLLYAIGEPPPVVMQEMGHTDPGSAIDLRPRHAPRRGRKRTLAGPRGGRRHGWFRHR